MPKLTADGARVTVHSLQDPGNSQFNAVEAMKLVFLTGDIRLREDICSGDVLVYDLSGSALSHLAQLTLPLVRKFMICGQVRTNINSVFYKAHTKINTWSSFKCSKLKN